MVVCVAGFLFSIATQNSEMFFICLLIGLVDLLLMFSINSIEIDYQARVIRQHRNYFIYQHGKTYSLNDFSHVVVLYSTSSSGGSIHGASASWNGSSYVHYEVYLIGRNKQRLMLKEFSDRFEAEKFQRQISEKTGIACADKMVPNRFESLLHKVKREAFRLPFEYLK